MRCPACQRGELIRHRRARYLYTECGLNNVILDGVDVLQCPACGACAAEVPNTAGLLDALFCAVILSDGILSPEQIRFIRRRLRLRAKDLASRCSITASHLSRIENGKDPISPQLSFTIRAKCQSHALTACTDEGVKQRLRDELEHLWDRDLQRLRGKKQCYAVIRARDLRDAADATTLPRLRQVERRPEGIFRHCPA